jgi:hypothetical protein
MKKLLPLWTLQTLLAVVAGTLISGMSFLAKSAIGIFKHHYRYYAFMKVWWQTALLFILVWLLLFSLQYFWYKRLPAAKARIRQLVFVGVAIIGLYFTYSDFRSDLSHRLAGERLHLGFYLFWLGWILQSVYLMVLPPALTDVGNTRPSRH